MTSTIVLNFGKETLYNTDNRGFFFDDRFYQIDNRIDDGFLVILILNFLLHQHLVPEAGELDLFAGLAGPMILAIGTCFLGVDLELDFFI